MRWEEGEEEEERRGFLQKPEEDRKARQRLKQSAASGFHSTVTRFPQIKHEQVHLQTASRNLTPGSQSAALPKPPGTNYTGAF